MNLVETSTTSPHYSSTRNVWGKQTKIWILTLRFKGLQVVAVPHWRWSFTRGCNWKALTGKILMFWIDDCLRGVVAHGGLIIVLVVFNVDCEQCLFFFRFNEGSARARKLWASPSVTCVVICVCRAFCSTDQEKIETGRSLFSMYLTTM